MSWNIRNMIKVKLFTNSRETSFARLIRKPRLATLLYLTGRAACALILLITAHAH